MSLRNIKNIDEIYEFLKNELYLPFLLKEKYDSFFEKLFSILFLVDAKKVQQGLNNMPKFGLREFFFTFSYLTLFLIIIWVFSFIFKIDDINFTIILLSMFIVFSLIMVLHLFDFLYSYSQYIFLNKKDFITMIIYDKKNIKNEIDKDILLNEFNNLLKQYPNKTVGQIIRILFSNIENIYFKNKEYSKLKEKEQIEIDEIKEKLEEIQKQLKIEKHLYN